MNGSKVKKNQVYPSLKRGIHRIYLAIFSMFHINIKSFFQRQGRWGEKDWKIEKRKRENRKMENREDGGRECVHGGC